jgi:transposase
VRERREAWHGRLKGVPLERLVVIDESAASTNMARLRGRCPEGERLVAAVPHGHWKVLTMIAAMTVRGVLTAVTVDAATDGEVFLRFVTQALVPRRCGPATVVVLDNLQAHKVKGVREAVEAVEAVEAAGATLLYLPPYSPDLSPIEPMWSKVKQGLRSIAARTVDALQDAVTSALLSITPSRLRGLLPPLRLHATDLTKML